MAVDDIVGIRIVGRYQDQNIVNTMHYQITAQSSPETTILSVLAGQWLSDFAASWVGMHAVGYTLVGTRAFSLSGVNKIPGIIDSGTAGTVVGDNLPAHTCRTITMYTASTNYRRRGRIMLSGSVHNDFEITDGSVKAATRGFMVTLGVQLIADVSSGGDTFSPGLAPKGVLPFEPFTGIKARKTPSVVRSRRIKGFMIG